MKLFVQKIQFSFIRGLPINELSNDFWNVSNFNKVGNSIILI